MGHCRSKNNCRLELPRVSIQRKADKTRGRSNISHHLRGKCYCYGAHSFTLFISAWLLNGSISQKKNIFPVFFFTLSVKRCKWETTEGQISTKWQFPLVPQRFLPHPASVPSQNEISAIACRSLNPDVASAIDAKEASIREHWWRRHVSRNVSIQSPW